MTKRRKSDKYSHLPPLGNIFAHSDEVRHGLAPPPLNSVNTLAMNNEKDMKDEVEQKNDSAQPNNGQPNTEQQLDEQTQAKADDKAPEATAEKAEQTEQPSEVDVLKKQLADLNDKYMRTCAEYDNYRKRTAREKADLIKSAGSDIILGLLPVVDDFERAIAHMKDDADVAAVKDGVDLIYKKFNDYLAKRGVTVIETANMPLDTNVHEAITMIPAPTPDMQGKILDCVEKGYKLGDKVLRFAKVVVCQ